MFSLHRLVVAACVAVALLAAPAVGFAQVQHLEGQIGPGALYEMDVPAGWNGALVLFAHGIVQAERPLLPPSEQEGYNLLRGALLANRYAVAASSFASNGWALADGVQRTHQLAGLFTSKFGRPKQILLAGLSLGGLVAVKLAETYPRQYDGALAMCAPLGGGLAEIRYAGDARVTFDAFFPGVLPGTPFEVPQGTEFTPPSTDPPKAGSPLFYSVAGAMTSDADAAMKAGAWIQAAGLPYNPAAAPDAPDGPLASALYFIGFQLRYTNDLIERVNGKVPYDNLDTVYGVPGAPDQTNQWLNAVVERFAADPAALNYYERNYQPTGDIRFPVVTLHTTWDPGVPMWHEDLFAAKVAEAGRSEFLTRRTATAWGHCNFSGPDILGAFNTLVAQVSAVNAGKGK